MSRYPEDEFDVAARQRGPKGVHRQAESALRRLLPYVVVLVAAPLLAWGVLSLLNQDNEAGTPVASASQGATAEPTASVTASGEPTAEATPSAEPTPAPETTQPAVEVNFAAPVAVLNGAGVQGIAGRTAERLQDAGFTAVTAADYQSAQPTVTTIYYNNADLAPTAQAVGLELGIDVLIELESATDSIAVVLRADFEE